MTGQVRIRFAGRRHAHKPNRTIDRADEGRDTEDIPIAYRISVLEHPLAPSRREGNKSLDSRYFFPSQREGIEGWAIENRRLPCQGIPKT